MQSFTLTSDVASLGNESSRIMDVPSSLHDKDDLLSWYAGALKLPDYFGSNWDACDECLRDLSWVTERRLVLYHQAIPLEASPNDQKIYIDVLLGALRDGKPGEAHELVVAFAPACEIDLRPWMQSDDGD